MTNKLHQQTSDYHRLRQLLLGNEQQQLEKIQQQLKDPQEQARRIAKVLPDAIARSQQQGDALKERLNPLIADSMRNSIKKDASIFADILYPVIGPAIRKSIAETIRQLLESINQSLEYSFSWQGLKWRFQAWRSHQSFAEIVLLNSMIYRVEQVFLIHKKTGTLIKHLTLPEILHQDADLVSAMLTAIQDFVHDSFELQTEQQLNQISIGDFSIWIEQGPDAVIAAAIRGNAPEQLRETLIFTLEHIHQQYSDLLHQFDGDNSQFSGIEEALQACLQSQYQKPEKRKNWRLYLLFVPMLLFVAYLVFLHIKEQQQWEQYLNTIKNEPGYVISHIDNSHQAYTLYGLHDPLAKPMNDFIQNRPDPDVRVNFKLQSYMSMDDAFLLRRIHKHFRIPASVKLALDKGRLKISGVADYSWARNFSQHLQYFPGIVSIDDSRLESRIDLSPLQLQDTIHYQLEDGKLKVWGRASAQWIKRAREIAPNIAGITEYDDSELYVDIDLAQLKPPQGVRLYMSSKNRYELIAEGTAPLRWIQQLKTAALEIDGIQSVNTRLLVNQDWQQLLALKAEIEKMPIFFDLAQTQHPNNSDTLLALMQKLDSFLEKLALLGKQAKIMIRGYSDTKGLYIRRLEISFQRAEFVRNTLIKHGVDPRMLEVESMVAKEKSGVPQAYRQLPDSELRKVELAIQIMDAKHTND